MKFNQFVSKLFERKITVLSLIFLSSFALLSYSAEFWANSKPIFMSVDGNWYFPIFKNYHPSEFGITESLSVDYRKIVESKQTTTVWPAIKWNPYESNTELSSYPSSPSSENLLGTDDRGRDVLTRLLYGYRYSITYAVLVWLITFSIGIFLGGVMGYLGGKVDFWGQRIVEILSSVPQFFLLLIIISIFRPNLWWLIGVSCLFGWISISYYVRGEVLKQKQLEYVEASRAIGKHPLLILIFHIIPNSLAPVLTFSPFVIAANVSALASLDYLGFGLMPPTPSWGELLSQGQKYFLTAWWLAVFPAFTLFLTLVSLSIVGDTVREILDPRSD